MKRVILLSGVIVSALTSAAFAVPDGMPNFTPGSLNPVMAPGAFGAYEMQLMKDQRQRQYIDEDFKLYQKKKQLEESGEVDTDIINDERLDLQSGSDANNTFIKRVKNRSKSNPEYIQNKGKVIVKEERDPDAKELKVKDEIKSSEEVFKPVNTRAAEQPAETETDTNIKPVSTVETPAAESAEPVKNENIQTPETIQQEDSKPQIKEDTLSSSSSYKPLIKQHKEKTWLNEISPDVPTVEPASFEDNFDAD